MTRLDLPTSRAVTRLTAYRYQGHRRVVVRLEEGGRLVRVRLEGTRTWHTLAVETLYRAAVACTVQAKKAERKAARAAKREAQR